jgi:dienelactone hydrolase
MILVHGYLGGRYSLEDRIWAARTLYARGVDVALATLPFHGVRAASHVSPPMFPSADARVTIEATRQAVFDLRGLLLLLRARGAKTVGAMGMSLGGYCVALLATLEPELAFAVPIVPLADLSDFARGRVPEPRSCAEARVSSRALSETLRVTSPLARPSKLSPDRVLVVGAAADRIAPLSHARELAAHFEARLEIMAGGHLLQLGRGRALESVNRFIERSL